MKEKEKEGTVGFSTPAEHRLALRLGIEWRRASKNRSIGRVVKVWFSHDGNPQRADSMCISEQVNGCTIAATRRAIVRAAAEIGRRISQE